MFTRLLYDLARLAGTTRHLDGSRYTHTRQKTAINLTLKRVLSLRDSYNLRSSGEFRALSLLSNLGKPADGQQKISWANLRMKPKLLQVSIKMKYIPEFGERSRSAKQRACLRRTEFMKVEPSKPLRVTMGELGGYSRWMSLRFFCSE